MLESQHGVNGKTSLANSVTVVVCAYTTDRWTTLRHAIDVTLNQINNTDELLVIVDHNDKLLAQCRDHLRGFSVFPNRHHRGLSGARNTALDEARGSIIVFLDDDAIPHEGWLDALRAPYIDERVYGVGGFATPHWLSGQPEWFPKEFLWVVGCSHWGISAAPHQVRNLVGANMSFRKAAFDQVGGFAEQMGRIGERLLGCEETEFSIRLTNANPDAIIMYQPSSKVEHQLMPDRASLGYFVRRCWSEGISKAELSRRVGRSRALSTERHYASRVLPRGIWNGLEDCAGGNLWGAARSAVIVLGFASTAAGYCMGAIFSPLSPTGEAT
ncbi:MAG: glycosyltransferase family 2 protein [Streptosporangiaceae bacterium]|jgi:glycosyltransferase involved in cell wall biosynthesis